MAWILAAFGLLAIGVIAGAIALRSRWSWAFPTAGFVGYVLAFRRGLLVWNPEGIDLAWRRALGSERSVDPRPPSAESPQSQRRAIRIVRGVFPNARAGRRPDAKPHQP